MRTALFVPGQSEWGGGAKGKIVVLLLVLVLVRPPWARLKNKIEGSRRLAKDLPVSELPATCQRPASDPPATCWQKSLAYNFFFAFPNQ